MNTKTDKKVKIMRFIGMMLIAVIMLTSFAAASTANFGEEGGKWVLKQVFWVALVVSAIIFIRYLMQGNFTKMLVTAAVASVTLVIVDDPQKLKTVGDAIWSVFNNGAA